MTKHTKITLSGARDIPFSALMLSQANVRRVKAGVSIDSLASDIERRGLLQSLTVRAHRDEEGNETGRYEVPAGGRRFRALQQLVKQRRMAKTEPVPCIVRDDEAVSAEEDSLAENVHREPLHPLDQFRAMQKLVEQGSDIETVAATFMVTPAVVKQRLKLADVSPKLHDIYAEDGMTLDQLMAFSVASDHARQEQVWDMLQTSHNQQPWFIRARLTEDKVRASDKRVRFVTLDAYIAAGGHVLRDLFESDDGGWLEDVALLDRLQTEKLETEVAAIAAEGWKWVEAAVDFPYGHTFGLRPLDGEESASSDEDEARLEALREEADRLEDQWAGEDDIPDEVAARIQAIDEEIAPLVSRPLIYHDGEVAIAGAFVCIDVDGSLHIERGFVRPDDEPAELTDDAGADADEDAGGEDRIGEIAANDNVGSAEESPDEEDPDDLLRPLSDSLVTDLTAHRTLALRDAVASSPLVAFAAILHALVLETFYTCATSGSCLGIAMRANRLIGYGTGLNDTVSAKSIHARHESWAARLPVMFESFIGLIVAGFIRPEIKRDQAAFTAFVRLPLNQKLERLADNCRGFARPIEQNNPAFGRYWSVVNRRNDLLHGNVDPVRDALEVVYFHGKRPLYKSGGDRIRQLWLRLIDQYNPQRVVDDYLAMHAFIIEIMDHLTPANSNTLGLIMEDSQPGWDNKRKIYGILFPEVVSTSVFGELRYDWQLQPPVRPKRAV